MDHYGQAESISATLLTAACDPHDPNEHGVCKICGGLRSDDGKSYEPPIQRPRHFFGRHDTLDLLVAQFIVATGKTPSESTVMDLMLWSANVNL